MNTGDDVKEICFTAGAFIVAGVIGFAVLMTSGCKGRDLAMSNATGEAIVRAQVRGDSALAHVNAAKPETTPKGRVHLDTASAELTTQHEDLSGSQRALKLEREEKAKLQAAYDEEHSHIENKAGRFVRGAVKIVIVVGLLGVILYNVALGLLAASPVGWVAGAARFLIRFLPAANPASWIRDKLKARRPMSPLRMAT